MHAEAGNADAADRSQDADSESADLLAMWTSGDRGSNRGGLRYTEKPRRDAIAQVRLSGRTVTEAARELGVSAEGLRNWVKRDAVGRWQGAPEELTMACSFTTPGTVIARLRLAGSVLPRTRYSGR
ncbi:transposase [Streptomyces sp. NPDC002306]